MSPSKSDKISNGSKCVSSIWSRAITANSEWPDKVNVTSCNITKKNYIIYLIR